jgi:polysaccharide biosynthesis transport protein
MELRDYINVIRARKWVIISAVLIAAFAAGAVSFFQPKEYEGSALVLIEEKDTGAALLGTAIPLSSQPERALQTQAQLVQARPVAEAVIKNLNLQMTPEELSRRVSVSTVGQTNIVRITATSSDPALAARIANTMAVQYVISARDARRASISAAADEVQKRLDQAKEEIVGLGQKIAASSQARDLSAQLSIATGTYSTLAEKYEQLRINEQLETGPARVVSTAVVSQRAVSPLPSRNVLFGGLFGLLFGMSMAFLYEYLDNTIKSTEEVEKLFGAPVLGTIPYEKFEKGSQRHLAIFQSPGSSTAEAYRVLRNSLDFVNFQHDMRTLLVTSAAPGEGKSTVASNLAGALAQAGKRVVLVSVDFRRPTTSQFFDINNMIGLSDVLLGTHSLKSALQRPGDDQLLILAAGKMPPNPSELLGSEKMREVVRALGEWGEWVILDSPPLLAVADPAAVARWADGALVVSQAGVTTREAAKKAMELLGKVGSRTVGVVISGLNESRAGSAGYGYYAGGYYYYSSYYGEPTEKSNSHGSAHTPADSESSADVTNQWMPQESSGRRLARTLGRVSVGVFAFLAVMVIAALIAYLLDGYFGWGLTGYLGRG